MGDLFPHHHQLAMGTLKVLVLLVSRFILLTAAATEDFTAPAACLKTYTAGEAYREAKHLHHVNNTLSLTLEYYTFKDESGYDSYCFITPEGDVNPTLHVTAGGILKIALINKVPAAVNITTAVNIHYHGLAVNPVTPGDNIVGISVDSGETFMYQVYIPSVHSPGLYWYHPHIYVISSLAVLGGASGALIIDDIEQYVPALAEMETNTIVIRGNLIAPTNITDDPLQATWDLSVNSIPANYPGYIPCKMTVPPSKQRFLRIANNHADAIVDLQFLYDGIPQPFLVVANDGVITDYANETTTSYFLSPANRVEIVIRTPPLGYKNATLVSRFIDTGPAGDMDPFRPLISFEVKSDAPAAPHMPALRTLPSGNTYVKEAEELRNMKTNVMRNLYFSEVISIPSDPESATNFYITVKGAEPTLFDPDSGPAIITQQGSVEEWVIENQAPESHVFHIHQVHFLVIAIDGKPVTQHHVYDSIVVPYCTDEMKAKNIPCPSVTIKMNWAMFAVGVFVYHCHILGELLLSSKAFDPLFPIYTVGAFFYACIHEYLLFPFFFSSRCKLFQPSMQTMRTGA